MAFGSRVAVSQLGADTPGPGEIIKSAGPHYHLYTSSKRTYRDLAEESVPFTLEEAMKTPRYQAINVLRSGGVTVPPFMAKMTPPPA